MADRTARDHQLVRQSLEGDRDAFGTLVEHYQRMVAAVAWRYGSDAASMDDVVSEVFLKAYTRLSQYQPEHAFSTWLYRLAVNHVIDCSRRRRREPERDELPASIASTTPDPAQVSEAGERQHLLRAALLGVVPRYREALFLVYIEGMSVKEAAAILGLPEGTVKTRLMRGRDALRIQLTRKHPEYFGESS